MGVWERLKEWYEGKYVPPPSIDPDSSFVIISPGHYEQPLVAKILRVIGNFWLAHWKWIIGTVLAVIAILVAV